MERKLSKVAERMKENVMKKLLAMFLVLGMASLANATVLDLVPYMITDSEGNPTDRDGSEENKLLPSDMVYLGLRLNYLDNEGGPDGYALTSFNLDVHVSGPASLALDTYTYYGYGPYVNWLVNPAAVTPGALSLNETTGNLDQWIGVVTAPQDVKGECIILAGGIVLHVEDGQGVINLDLTLNGTTSYALGCFPAGAPWPADPGWVSATEDDLGGLTLNIPEPITMALLGVGGLLLRRRR
jgi:hypothetical protein